MAKSGRPRKYDAIADDISRAIKLNDYIKAQTLISESSIDVLDGYGRSPLMCAAFHGNLTMLDWLILNGANINLQDRNGWSSLHAASDNKHSAIIIKLIENGANPNLIDSHGNGPLWTATMSAKGDDTIPILLRNAGADGDHKNNHGRSPNDMQALFSKNLEKSDEQEGANA